MKKNWNVKKYIKKKQPIIIQTVTSGAGLPRRASKSCKSDVASISRFSRSPFSCAKDDMIHYLRWTVFLWIVNSILCTSGMAVNERIGMYAVTKSSAPRCLLVLVRLQKVWLEEITSVWFFKPCSSPHKRSMLTSTL